MVVRAVASAQTSRGLGAGLGHGPHRATRDKAREHRLDRLVDDAPADLPQPIDHLPEPDATD